MKEKKLFVDRYGVDLYDTFIYWLREDIVNDYKFDNLMFFVSTRGKHRKRSIERLKYRHATKELCAITLSNFATRGDLLSHIYEHRNDFGFYIDKNNNLYTSWR